MTNNGLGLALALIFSGMPALTQQLPNMGQQITPLKAPGSQFVTLNPGLPDKPDWLASHAVTSVVSPDRKTLLVLTSGYNRVFDVTTGPATGLALTSWNTKDSFEYVFIYDISSGTPVQTQVLQVPNTYHGIVFDPLVDAFYVAGGGDDDLHIFTRSAPAAWAEAAGSPISLGHKRTGVGLGVTPCAAGLAVSKNGQMLVVADYYNDAITVFTGGYGKWSQPTDLDLRPGKSKSSPQPGTPGGEYPFWVAVKGDGSNAKPYKAWVSSIRDREIDVVSLSGTPAVTARIKVTGQPNKMTLNAAESRLYVAEDQSDTVDVIDTGTNAILETIPVVAHLSAVPEWLAPYKGANPNSVALSPDEKQLYVTDGNLNCISVVTLGGGRGTSQVTGLIPTGWYPNSVSLVSFGVGSTYAYVVNGKSPTGKNAEACYGGYGPPLSKNCMAGGEYNPQLTKAGLQSFPLPGAPDLATLTAQVATNNRFASTESASDAAVMAAVHQGVQHVIFIIRENRTYDQILGDLEIGNGDPALVEFGEQTTPNQHNLARSFVTLDNFMDTAEVSYDGWLWSTSAQAPDVVQHQYPVVYAFRAMSLDSEGLNRNVNVAIPTVAGRVAANPVNPADPDVLPGQTDAAAPDGPDNEINTGYLWDSAIRANLTVRNYGFFVDGTRYGLTGAAAKLNIPVLRDPFSSGTIVSYPTNVALTPYTDRYFRGFDNSLPDYWRYKEWAREFDAMNQQARLTFGTVSPNPLPALSLVRFMHDHTGNFDVAIDGVNTPEREVADNDYAVGLLIQKVANSAFANNTLIFVIEDDAQDGGDHVDSHRSIAFVAGAYVKQHALVSTPYNTVNFLRTIEEVLGLPPMNLNDALARPMADIFNATPSPWNFKATPSPLLYAADVTLPLPPRPLGLIVPKTAHDAKYWAQVTKGMDFTSEDRLDPALFNRILWKGVMGGRPYPAQSTGLNLRQNREEFLSRYRQSLRQTALQKKGND